MTDRELLELAAKAAGIKIFSYQHDKINGTINGKTNFHWNPLIDDGDAFRLAVDLGLRIRIELDPIGLTEIVVPVVDFAGSGLFALTEFHKCYDNDRHAATRRAIVRAAAQIGSNRK